MANLDALVQTLNSDKLIPTRYDVFFFKEVPLGEMRRLGEESLLKLLVDEDGVSFEAQCEIDPDEDWIDDPIIQRERNGEPKLDKDGSPVTIKTPDGEVKTKRRLLSKSEKLIGKLTPSIAKALTEDLTKALDSGNLEAQKTTTSD